MFKCWYKKHLRRMIFIFLLNVLSPCLFAQDTDSSNFFLSNEAHALFNDNMANPAYTGIFNGHHVHILGAVNNPFYNYGNFLLPYNAGATYDFTFGKKINQSLGMFYKRYQEGVQRGYRVGLSYAHMFNIHITKTFYHKIRAGAALSYHKEHFDRKLLTFGDMIDPKYGFVWNTMEFSGLWHRRDTLSTLVGLNTGFWYHNPYGYLGMAAGYAGSYDTTLQKIYTLPGFLNFAAGGHVYLNDIYTLHPALNIEWGMGEMKTLSSWSPSLTFSRNDKLYLGLQYRDMNVLTVVAALNAGSVLSFSLMYGINPACGFAWYNAALMGTQLRLKIR
ncbi:MAG: hypothetical protein BWY70_00173 [Bacteroidetes bacterium ADurb.Bin408]|nr:MAG: hypothetical protein BWY70_00173 [Bacteroidetes bacterium ADurb.Bin408]